MKLCKFHCPRVNRLETHAAIELAKLASKARAINLEAIAAHKQGLSWPLKALPLIPRGEFLAFIQAR